MVKEKARGRFTCFTMSGAQGVQETSSTSGSASSEEEWMRSSWLPVHLEGGSNANRRLQRAYHGEIWLPPGEIRAKNRDIPLSRDSKTPPHKGVDTRTTMRPTAMCTIALSQA